MSTPITPRPHPWRRAVMVATSLLAVVLLAFSLKVWLMVAGNESGRQSYAAGESERAAEAFGANLRLNVLEPWVAHFNKGTAHYQAEQWQLAEDEFRAALAQVPEQHACMVALDLAWTIEAQGDELAADGKSDEARARWAEARKVLDGSRCGQLPDGSPSPTPTPSPQSPSPSPSGSPTPSGSPSPGPSDGGSPTPSAPSTEPPSEQEQKEQSERTRQRLEKKEQGASTASPSPSGSGSPQLSPGPSQSSDPRSEQGKQEKLKQRQEKAQQERSQRKDRKDTSSSDVDKPW